MKLNTNKTALVFGSFASTMHLVWALMVYFGVAQQYVTWVYGLHLVSIPFVVLPFSFNTALMLVIFAFVMGYVMGWIFAWIWNYLHKGK